MSSKKQFFIIKIQSIFTFLYYFILCIFYIIKCPNNCVKSAVTFGFFDGLLVYHLRIVITHIRLSGCVFKLVANAEAQVVLEFPMENMQLPMNYFKLECYLLSFRIAEQMTIMEYMPIES